MMEQRDIQWQEGKGAREESEARLNDNERLTRLAPFVHLVSRRTLVGELWVRGRVGWVSGRVEGMRSACVSECGYVDAEETGQGRRGGGESEGERGGGRSRRATDKTLSHQPTKPKRDFEARLFAFCRVMDAWARVSVIIIIIIQSIVFMRPLAYLSFFFLFFDRSTSSLDASSLDPFRPTNFYLGDVIKTTKSAHLSNYPGPTHPSASFLLFLQSGSYMMLHITQSLIDHSCSTYPRIASLIVLTHLYLCRQRRVTYIAG